MPKKKKGKPKKNQNADSTPEDKFSLDEIDQACKEIEEEFRKEERRKTSKESEAIKHKDTISNNTSASTTKENKSIIENNPRDKTRGEGSMVRAELNKEKIEKTVHVVIEHLNKYGACVIDEFLGEEKGTAILKEVLELQQREMFQAGQLASASGAEKLIRSDKITWADGVNPPCPNMKFLIDTFDEIVTSANKAANNGILGNYNISSRTNAMVACYPGEGTHYVKHVDNPSKDGRCITAIYYLNKDWKSQRDGGILKISSTFVKGVVAQVEPLFDRVIFFWSDMRNPHEVMPSFRERYAITLWYNDEKEKREYEERKKQTEKKEKL